MMNYIETLEKQNEELRRLLTDAEIMVEWHNERIYTKLEFSYIVEIKTIDPRKKPPAESQFEAIHLPRHEFNIWLKAARMDIQNVIDILESNPHFSIGLKKEVISIWFYIEARFRDKSYQHKFLLRWGR